MRRVSQVTVIGAVLFTLCSMAAAQAPAAQSSDRIAAAAMSGRVLIRSELEDIYQGRTWYWKDGAAYFRPDRKFEAWVGEGADASYGEGSWSVSNNGQLCIRALWGSVSGSSNAFTCYVHRKSDAIYQRELPNGNWYLFGHTPSQPGDEMEKLERGDHVSAGFMRAKRYVIRHAPRKP